MLIMNDFRRKTFGFQIDWPTPRRWAAKISQTLRRTRKMLVVLPIVFFRHILVLLALITLVGCETGCQPQSQAWVPNTSLGHPFLANDFATPTPRPIH